MKLVIAAERGITSPGPAVLVKMAEAIIAMPSLSEVAVRGPRGGGPTGDVERAVIEMAHICGMIPAIYMPEPSPDARAATYDRDYKLVTGADLVLAFFTEGSDMGGGTGHVVKAAVDRETAIEAYSVSESGDLRVLVADGGWREHEVPDDIDERGS